MIYGDPIILGGGGSGGDVYAFIVAAYPAGSVCTASSGSTTLTAGDTSGSWVFKIPAAGTWTVTCTDGTDTASTTVTISTEGQSESVELSYLVPAEYQAVEYLERPEQSGDYFNTGIVPVRTDFVEVRYKILTYGTYPWILGLTVAGGYWGVTTTPAASTQFHAYPNNTEVSGLTNCDAVVQFTDGKVRYSSDDGENFTEVSLANSTSPTNPFLIFAIQGYVQKGANNMRVQRVTIADAEFVPCYRKSDSVPGFWNKRDEVFITKTGTDSILVGPDL